MRNESKQWCLCMAVDTIFLFSLIKKMNFSYYKYCIVPQCKSTSIKTPNKLFIYVPRYKNMRRKWLKLARRDSVNSLSTDSRMYFCEDHFDLPNDMVNYMEYHIMGTVSKVLMKPGCTPSKFECQEDRRKRTCSSIERPYFVKKQRMMTIAECLNDSEKSCTSNSSLKDTSDTSLNGEQMWTSEDITSLISLVQIHSMLYDPSDPDYSNTEIVNTIWQQIGIKLKRTSESCSNKWRELQSEYQKRSNNLKFNSNHKSKDWVYFGSLDFLKQYIQDTLYNESSLPDNLNPILFVSSNSQSSEVIQNVSTGDIFNETSSSASTDSVSIKSEIEVEDNFVEIQNHSGNDISNEMESDSKLNQDMDNTIDNEYSLSEIESHFPTNDLNLETNVDGTKKSMKLFLLSLLEDASHLSIPAQREFKLKTLALLHKLQ